MQITSLEEYGLRCALNLASTTKHLSSSQIAEREGISVEYVSKIMHLFRKAGVVKAVRGVNGGFSLSSRAEEVSVKTIFDALNGKPLGEEAVKAFCAQHSGHQTTCAHISDCAVRPVWMVLQTYFSELLGEVKLVDLLVGEKKVTEALEAMAQKQVLKVRARIESKKNNVCPASAEAGV